MQIDLATVGYLAGWRLARLAPDALVSWVYPRLADVASKHGRGGEYLRRNLARVVGEENVTARLVRDSMRSYARYWVEAFRLPGLVRGERLEALLDEIDDAIVGKEYLVASRRSGKGVVLTLPHSGNWDMAGVYLTHRFGSFTTVAERLRPEALFQAFVDYRESLGFSVLPLTGAGPTLPRLESVLSAGGIVCLLGERDLKRNGREVEFFGETTTMPTGSVDLARRTGSALHVVHCWYPGPGRWGISCSPPVDCSEPARAQQRVADLFAANIAAHPQDWHMLQPLWPRDRDLRRRRRAAAPVAARRLPRTPLARVRWR